MLNACHCFISSRVGAITIAVLAFILKYQKMPEPLISYGFSRDIFFGGTIQKNALVKGGCVFSYIPPRRVLLHCGEEIEYNIAVSD